MNSGPMNIRQCYTLLELPPRASLDDVKESYKDLVQVWHPDRFSHSPRLQQKAQDKLQQLNEAYNTLKAHLERQTLEGAYYLTTEPMGKPGVGGPRDRPRSPGTSTGAAASTGPEDHRSPWTRSHPESSEFAGVSFTASNPQSLRWRLQAMGVILGLLALLLVPLLLTLVIAQHPLLVGLMLLLPVGAYGYRLWTTR